MKTKGNRIVSGIFNGIFAATLLTEIVCGLIWAFYNFTDYKNFAESQNLYALLSSSAWMLPVIYILQIIVTGAFFYFASAAFLRAVTGDRVPARYPFLLMLLILFNPYVWMTEFTLLPDAPGLPDAHDHLPLKLDCDVHRPDLRLFPHEEPRSGVLLRKIRAGCRKARHRLIFSFTLFHTYHRRVSCPPRIPKPRVLPTEP